MVGVDLPLSIHFVLDICFEVFISKIYSSIPGFVNEEDLQKNLGNLLYLLFILILLVLSGPVLWEPSLLWFLFLSSDAHKFYSFFPLQIQIYHPNTIQNWLNIKRRKKGEGSIRPNAFLTFRAWGRGIRENSFTQNQLCWLH